MKIKPADIGLLVDDWRNNQLEAIESCVYGSKRFVGMCAPTGWGKSIALIGAGILSGKRTLILTSSKGLQNQYSKEFQSLNILDIRGKANYSCRATEVGGEFYDGSQARSVAEGPCQFGEECGLRSYGCIYYDKVNAAKYRKLVVANYAAWISSNMYTEGWGKFDVICMDEADTAEGWLARMLAVRLPRCHTNVLGKYPNGTRIGTWAA